MTRGDSAGAMVRRCRRQSSPSLRKRSLADDGAHDADRGGRPPVIRRIGQQHMLDPRRRVDQQELVAEEGLAQQLLFIGAGRPDLERVVAKRRQPPARRQLAQRDRRAGRLEQAGCGVGPHGRSRPSWATASIARHDPGARVLFARLGGMGATIFEAVVEPAGQMLAHGDGAVPPPQPNLLLRVKPWGGRRPAWPRSPRQSASAVSVCAARSPWRQVSPSA